MAKVKLLVPMGTVEKSYIKGDIFECSKEEAQRLVDAEFAEPIEAKNKGGRAKK